MRTLFFANELDVALRLNPGASVVYRKGSLVVVELPKVLKCDLCDREGAVCVPDPLVQEICGENEWINLCEACYDKRCLEV